MTADATSPSLLDRARHNVPGAWDRLVECYAPLVYHWCRRGHLGPEDTADVFQDVFRSVAEHLTDFRRDRPGDTFRGWLRAITRNQIALLFRRNRDRPQAAGGSDAWQDLQDVADPCPAPGEETAEIDQLYRRALDLVRREFEERTWQAFWLSVVEDRAPAALAQELNMTTNTIRQAKSRVLRRLREEVGDLLG